MENNKQQDPILAEWAQHRGISIDGWDAYAKASNDFKAQLKMKELVVLTIDDVKNLLCSAIEGGVDYWCDIGTKSNALIYSTTYEMKGQPFVDRLWAALERGVPVNIYDVNDQPGKRKKLGTLTEFSVQKQKSF